MRLPLSLTARVSLLFAAAAAAVLLVAGALFEHAAEDHFLDDDRQELAGKMELIRRLLANATTPAAVGDLPTLVAGTTFGHPGIAIAVASADGAVIYSTGPRAVIRHLLASGELDAAQPATWSYGEHAYRIAARRMSLGVPASPPVLVAVALDITGDRTFMNEFKQFLWFGMALSILVMAMLGWIAAQRGLLPLHRLSARVAAISARHLDKPLPEADLPGELRELVRAFNRMLTRLEDSFRRLSEFSSDLAHELRTPIQNLLMQTQVTLSRERDAAEYRDNLQANLEELERLSRMTADMLFLAKADNRLVALRREPLDLQREGEQLLAFYEAYATDRGVALAQTGAATVSGDRLMVQRALANLLSNAIRFTPRGGTVTLDLSESEETVTVSVTNPGPEIPPEQRTRIFERLYRVDPSRREGDAEHAGLGLAITKSIVELHGGSIRAESSGGRTRFSALLPR
jgi:two-component system heavy metal sensor histidine kinase CusS